MAVFVAAALALGCGGGGNGREPVPCGHVDPATGEAPICGADQLCVCLTGECAMAESSCSTRYRLVREGGSCLSHAQVASLVPATEAEHPVCLAADADADADVEAEADEGERFDEVGPEDAPPELPDGPHTIELVVFAGEELTSGPTGRQRVTRDVGFPVPGPFERILLQLDVRTGCPTLCDPVSRVTTVTLDLGGGTTVELLRAFTPYGGDATFVEDLTDLAPLLTMTHPVTLFLDTRIGGWEADLTFLFSTGTPARAPRSATALYDEPDFTATTDLPERLVYVPAGIAGARLFYRVTGHSTSGTGCDETCAKSAFVSIDGLQRLELTPWRTDCAGFVATNPLGDPAVVSLSRSGWCPGDIVLQASSDVSAWVTPGDHTFDLTIADVDPTTGTWRVGLVLVLYR